MEKRVSETTRLATTTSASQEISSEENEVDGTKTKERVNHDKGYKTILERPANQTQNVALRLFLRNETGNYKKSPVTEAGIGTRLTWNKVSFLDVTTERKRDYSDRITKPLVSTTESIWEKSSRNEESKANERKVEGGSGQKWNKEEFLDATIERKTPNSDIRTKPLTLTTEAILIKSSPNVRMITTERKTENYDITTKPLASNIEIRLNKSSPIVELKSPFLEKNATLPLYRNLLNNSSMAETHESPPPPQRQAMAIREVPIVFVVLPRDDYQFPAKTAPSQTRSRDDMSKINTVWKRISNVCDDDGDCSEGMMCLRGACAVIAVVRSNARSRAEQKETEH
jgi:hypothetical protein